MYFPYFVLSWRGRHVLPSTFLAMWCRSLRFLQEEAMEVLERLLSWPQEDRHTRRSRTEPHADVTAERDVKDRDIDKDHDT